MRLTCPNCGAQYEVPDDVIPSEGRDVQCSNCGTTWFQPHADQMNEPVPDEAPAAAPPPEDPADLPEQTPVAEPAEAAEAPEPAPRRELDPEVTGILQEEAERETRLRAAEDAGLETQPDLGLTDTADDAERRAQQARERVDRIKGPEEGAAPRDPAPDLDEAAIAAAVAETENARRDRLPNIDELNSSLRPTGSETADDEAPAEPAASQPGFARGFAIPLLIVAILLLLYLAAPQIAASVPALEPALAAYVGAIDQLRSWLDGLISSVAT